jgi:hypothetical protein
VPQTPNAPAGARALWRAAHLLAAALVALAVQAVPVNAQNQVRVTAAEENVRAEPNGDRVAVVNRDFRFAAGATRGQWRAVTLDAWVPARSIIVSRRDGFNVVVAGGGAALHSEPGGAPMGRAMGGVQFNEITRQGAWARVQRPAWIWSPSLAAAPAPAARTAAAQPAPPRSAPATQPAQSAPSVSPGDSARPAPARPPGRVLHGTPNGDTIGSVAQSARLEVIGREGEWARVRMEGWVRTGSNGDVEQPGALRDVSLRALRSDPDRYRGVAVQWQIQFMALQRADSVRTDFQRGEPYILARDPGGEPGFVYIAVPADHLSAVRRLSPLERVEVVARVRNGRSPLTGHPVLELLELRR